MNKKKCLCLTGIVLMFSMGSSSLSANAATWHNGTPSKIRGHWEDQDVYVGKLFHNEIKYAHMSFTISKKNCRYTYWAVGGYDNSPSQVEISWQR
ncbi:hypothetical protein [Secundilactobacillus odoratitofui]|uniref:hypothetical protein n=1 Tax=Secundilactobacillus odoratitofui TaxID=480930 RepID=UPI0006D1D139|nr:hypothetical protein [Secundilactobacillus odoratitofui]